ncbi:sensor histidine kinase [Steroidobacter cummioxidans]|uniref:sensor histidine kinase n=1 Tax=Steroidobacter cummioxidans TaxID=1803913 RepID=UPI000E31DE80|nr:ATP-binding protein [Steroidobacter cummioxidans]
MIAFAQRLWTSLAFRQALGYGAMVVLTMLILLAIFYMQTVGVWQRRIDQQIRSASLRLVEHFEHEGDQSLAHRISVILGDGVNSDTEIYLLLDAAGRDLAGNVTSLPESLVPGPEIVEQAVMRSGRESVARLQVTRLADDQMLVVGRDMQDQRELRQLIRRASISGGAITLIMAVAGALAFRRRLERRIGAIRQAAARIEDGDLQQRIPVSQQEDEFARLTRDINSMLDRIHALMDGVRHVSNTIAHNIRTPLSRVSARLQVGRDSGQLAEATEFAIRELQDLNIVFEKLLKIAEAESGARRSNFVSVSLDDVATNVIQLYDALAEARSSTLTYVCQDQPQTLGDPHLIANAVANLVDNALKYTQPGAAIRLETAHADGWVTVTVRDNGRGIPSEELPRVGERFYRLDRSLPGYGLGLASVVAVARLHGGCLQLEDAKPGLIARLVLPALER